MRTGGIRCAKARRSHRQPGFARLDVHSRRQALPARIPRRSARARHACAEAVASSRGNHPEDPAAQDGPCLFEDLDGGGFAPGRDDGERPAQACGRAGSGRARRCRNEVWQSFGRVRGCGPCKGGMRRGAPVSSISPLCDGLVGNGRRESVRGGRKAGSSDAGGLRPAVLRRRRLHCDASCRRRPFLAKSFDHLLISCYHGIPGTPSAQGRLIARALHDRRRLLHHLLAGPRDLLPRSVHANDPGICSKRRPEPDAVLDVVPVAIGRANLWLQPFTDLEFVRLAKAGKKPWLVMCPSFLADCLETLEEISMAGRATFLDAGGEHFEKIFVSERCPRIHRFSRKPCA